MHFRDMREQLYLQMSFSKINIEIEHGWLTTGRGICSLHPWVPQNLCTVVSFASFCQNQQYKNWHTRWQLIWPTYIAAYVKLISLNSIKFI